MPAARAICAMRAIKSSMSRPDVIIKSDSSSITITMKGSSSIFSAEIKVRPNGKNGNPKLVFSMEGMIEKGDYEKLKSLIDTNGFKYNNLIVASKGGDIIEAMKIGYLIRELQYDTTAPLRLSPLGKTHSFDVKDKSNDVCASACFFIYVAGVRRRGNLIGIQNVKKSVYEGHPAHITTKFESYLAVPL